MPGENHQQTFFHYLPQGDSNLGGEWFCGLLVCALDHSPTEAPLKHLTFTKMHYGDMNKTKCQLIETMTTKKSG